MERILIMRKIPQYEAQIKLGPIPRTSDNSFLTALEFLRNRASGNKEICELIEKIDDMLLDNQHSKEWVTRYGVDYNMREDFANQLTALSDLPYTRFGNVYSDTGYYVCSNYTYRRPKYRSLVEAIENGADGNVLISNSHGMSCYLFQNGQPVHKWWHTSLRDMV
jgi:hypothetical protein